MRTILVDADIIAYKAACVAEAKIDFNGDGFRAVAVTPKQARSNADRIIRDLADHLKAAFVVVCLSDPAENFRKQLDPTYKANRKDTVPPVLLREIKEYLGEEYTSFVRPRLEADDVMGILSGHPTLVEGEKIMVSEDKDMRTLPGLIYNPNQPQLGVIDVSPLDADRFHLWQTIVGDATDGYPGCPKVGPKSHWAEEIISADAEDLWDLVLDAYHSRGLGSEEALLQARLARILRPIDYNFTTKKIRLWTPDKLSVN